MSLLSPASLEYLRGAGNLLAFSAGVDSSALFFLLTEAGIDFDIALVNYRTRDTSDAEAEHASRLAQRYGKKCYITTAELPTANFEHEARKVRYAFFEEIIRNEGYQNLITAHHLNDRLEWFLMQLTRGAGLAEMLGFEEIETREGYSLIRPLIRTDKARLRAYLKEHKLPFFEDRSNHDETITRNYFRSRFANPLIEAYKEGIVKSFDYLERDKKALFDLSVRERHRSFWLLQSSGDNIRDIRQIDHVLKREGYLMSAAQREEALRTKDCVVGRRFAVVFRSGKIYIAPYRKTVMPKAFKEACRLADIPPKIRSYLFETGYPLSEKKRPSASGPEAL